jgi:VWFA-related protein
MLPPTLKTVNRQSRLFVALLALVLLAPFAQAQTTPSADAPPAASQFPDTPPDQNKPAATLKVNVNLVSLYFTVRDKHNGLIPTLAKSDCGVTEDKQPQTIKNFSAESNLPLTLGLLIDTSGSQQNVLPLEQQAADNFLRSIMRSKDEGFVVSFDVGVNLEQDFTSSVGELSRAIDHTQINIGSGGIGGPVPTQGAPRGTLLYDAVAQVSNDKIRSETGRKAIILLTDGEDQGSTTKPNEAMEAAQKANVIIYVILIADRPFYSGGFNMGLGYTGDAQMRRLTEETGGRVINVGNNGKKLEDAFAQIEQELRTQYLASYTSTNNKLDGTYRKLEISCKGDGLKVQARKGYYAIGEPQ